MERNCLATIRAVEAGCVVVDRDRLVISRHVISERDILVNDIVAEREPVETGLTIGVGRLCDAVHCEVNACMRVVAWSVGRMLTRLRDQNRTHVETVGIRTVSRISGAISASRDGGRS